MTTAHQKMLALIEALKEARCEIHNPGQYLHRTRGEDITVMIDEAIAAAEAEEAAQPDLLSAAEGALDALDTLTSDDFALGRDRPQREALRAAIAKAKGE